MAEQETPPYDENDGSVSYPPTTHAPGGHGIYIELLGTTAQAWCRGCDFNTGVVTTHHRFERTYDENDGSVTYPSNGPTPTPSDAADVIGQAIEHRRQTK